MTGALRQRLIQHFSVLDNLEDTDLGRSNAQYLWTQNDSTGIVIESITKFDPHQIENRPALIIKRHSWKPMRLGIDNRLQGFTAGDGSRAYAHLWQGAHTVFCLAGQGAECEKLAAEVYRELNEFAPALRADLNLKRLELGEVGEVSLLEESSEHFAVPVTLVYAFEEAWKTVPRALALAKGTLTVLEP